MIRYRGLGHVALNVTDPERSRRFYEEVVGLQFESTGPDGEVVLRAGGEQQVLLYRGAKAGLKRLGWHMGDEAQLDRLAPTLERSGVRWRARLERHPNRRTKHRRHTGFSCGPVGPE